ncbi:MAG: NAD(P)-dependent oxidoreductase, partial [Pseudomonadota bacterium]
MTILVTGAAGHLGEAVMRGLRADGVAARGLDVKATSFVDCVGSITDRAFVADAMRGADAVIHAATLHKPHVATHSRQAFVDANITGALNLLEEAAAVGVASFVFISTTSVYGHAMAPAEGAPAVWVDETLTPKPKNIYGVTKIAAENLCALVHRQTDMPCLILRTSRFFPEEDDVKAMRDGYAEANLKAIEELVRLQI